MDYIGSYVVYESMRTVLWEGIYRPTPAEAPISTVLEELVRQACDCLKIDVCFECVNFM